MSVRTFSRSRVYRAPEVCRVVGVSYRQLDWWDRTGLIQPSIALAQGSGSQRLYSTDDVLMIRAIRRLLMLGVSLQSIRGMVAPSEPGEPIGLRDAIRQRKKRWSVGLADGAAGVWLDLASLRDGLGEPKGIPA